MIVYLMKALQREELMIDGVCGTDIYAMSALDTGVLTLNGDRGVGSRLAEDARRTNCYATAALDTCLGMNKNTHNDIAINKLNESLKLTSLCSFVISIKIDYIRINTGHPYISVGLAIAFM